MATSAARKAAVTRKRRTAARKAATTRKRRAAGKKAAITRKRRTSHEKHCASHQHTVCRPHDLLRGWDRGFGMASQGVWVSRDGASHDAGWEAFTRRDGGG